MQNYPTVNAIGFHWKLPAVCYSKEIDIRTDEDKDGESITELGRRTNLHADSWNFQILVFV